LQVRALPGAKSFTRAVLQAIQRTEWNVRDSDATVLFSLAPELTGGSKKTARVREEASQALDSSGGWQSERRSEAQRLAGAKTQFMS
jgi:Circularly permutated YpsA SLOG family